MSLLNDVLKDLDKQKRRSQSAVSFAAVHPALKWFHQFPPISIWLLTPFLCCGLFLWITYYAQGAKKPRDEGNHANISTPSVSTLVSIPHAPPTTAVQLVSILPTIILPTPATISSEISMNESSVPAANAGTEEVVKKVFSPLTDAEWHDEQLNIALEAIEQGNEDIAETVLTQLLNKFPNAIDARETLSKLYLVQGDYNAASRLLDEGLRLQPNILSFNQLKARLFFEQNHPQQALILLQKFHPDIQKNPDFYGLLAAILQSLDRLNESGNLYKVLVEIEPDNGQYWLGYAISLESKHNKTQAISAYTKAATQYDAEAAVRTFAENRLKRLQG